MEEQPGGGKNSFELHVQRMCPVIYLKYNFAFEAS